MTKNKDKDHDEHGGELDKKVRAIKYLNAARRRRGGKGKTV